MIKYEFRAVTQRVDVPVEVVCNQCGSTAPVPDGCLGAEEVQRFHHFAVSGSYSSEFPPDMTLLEFDLCAGCLRALSQGFRVPIEWPE